MARRPEPAPLDQPVFFTSVALLVAIVGLTAIFPAQANALFEQVLGAIIDNGSWYYVFVVAVVLVTLVMISVTRYGDIKLGPDHAEPEYSFFSWFAMLFAAGMGIGLMFFGVAEPVMHFLEPPHGDPATIPAAREAMKLTFFHWGVHAWAVYAIVAVILAYFGFRHDLPLTLRSALYPLIGERIYGPVGAAVDIFAILSTTFGVATSLGFGVDQISSGLGYLFDVPKSNAVQIALIIGTTALATISVVLGLDVGIRRLSEINMLLAALLLISILLLGPTVLLMQAFMQNTGSYLADIVGKTFNLYAYDPTDWLGGWTIFYWGWWLSWSPFVGLFIARISRGRTLREFVLGAMLGPALFTLLWMTVFGNSAIDLILNQHDSDLAAAVRSDESIALFKFLEHYPLSQLLSGLAICMVAVFFITSADSGAMVLNMLSSRGHDNTPNTRRVFWMSAIGATAIVLLLAGGLPALQTAAIASALPFSLAILAAIWGLIRALSADQAKRNALLTATLAPTMPWRQRLENALRYPSRGEVSAFIEDTVLGAMNDFTAAAGSQRLTVLVSHDGNAGSVRMQVVENGEVDFLYEVVCTAHSRAAANEQPGNTEYFRAEVHHQEGSLGYDIMGWSREQVADDIVEQYERHMRYLSALR